MKTDIKDFNFARREASREICSLVASRAADIYTARSGGRATSVGLESLFTPDEINAQLDTLEKHRADDIATLSNLLKEIWSMKETQRKGEEETNDE